MSIESIRSVAPPLKDPMKDHVDATVEAMKLLGVVKDPDQLADELYTDFNALDWSGRTGEAFVQLPRSIISVDQMISKIDNAVYRNGVYRPSFVEEELWTPGFDPNGYKTEDLSNLTRTGDGSFSTHARLAVYNPDENHEPLLHFTDKCFDRSIGNTKRRQDTQLEAVDSAVADYAAEGHGDFSMAPLNAAGIIMLALVRRIQGQPMPKEKIFIRDATLDLKTVKRGRYVGALTFADGTIQMAVSDGGSGIYSGVGLSVGPKKV